MSRFKGVRLSLIILNAIAVIVIIGCATTPPPPADPRMFGYSDCFTVTVNSLAAPDAASKGKTVFITSGMRNVSDNDLEFIEAAKYIENALSKKGYIRASDVETADLLIRLGYGIGNPQTSSETVTTSRGYSYPVGWMWYTVPPQTATVQTTTYMRNLMLEAYDLKDPKRKSQLWKATVKSEGTNADLHRVLVYMIAASSEYFGSSTGMQKELRIWGHDPRVLEIWR